MLKNRAGCTGGKRLVKPDTGRQPLVLPARYKDWQLCEGCQSKRKEISMKAITTTSEARMKLLHDTQLIIQAGRA